MGEVSYRRISISVIAPDCSKRFRKVTEAPNGQSFTQQAVDELLAKTAENIEREFPEHDYRMVCVGKGQYNFVPTGRRAVNVAQAMVSKAVRQFHSEVVADVIGQGGIDEVPR